MSDDEETYCRLCAEPTPKEQLISPDEDVAISSKVVTKMLWINIDVTQSGGLPTTICFACFDLLERTWNFVHDVRIAQEKLLSIFLPKNCVQNKTTGSDSIPDNQTNAEKPVNENCPRFPDSSLEVKSDPDNNFEVITSTGAGSLLNLEVTAVKTERLTDGEHEDGQDYTMDDEGFNTSDSDLPLRCSGKKKKTKKKRKIMYDSEISTEDILVKTETDAVPLAITALTTTWEEYSCRCAKCDALFKNVTSLRLHSKQIHTSCSVFKCAECGKVFAHYKSFINHARRHKKGLRYCCEYCNTQFPYLRKHINKTHNDIWLNMCQNCGAIFDNEEQLQDHLVLYGKGYKKARRKESIECDLKCQDCKKEFKSRSNLQQHRLVHTERSRDFSCHVCGKMFFTKGTLSTHMNTHEDMKPFKCEYCSMAFRARGNLQSHVSLHSGAKPFVCEQCGKSFRVKRHLKSHSIVHTDLMPYVCEYCHKPFRFKTRLNLHLRQHTGMKPYKCVHCQRDFTNGSNFKKHMKRKHNVDTSSRKRIKVVNELNTDSEVRSGQS